MKGKQMTIKEKLSKYGGFYDADILRHGFTAYNRDYDILFSLYGGGKYLLRFSHVPEVTTTTLSSIMHVWSDVFIDYDEWLAAGEPLGWVWGTCVSGIDPGLSYIDNSPRAKLWSERLGHQMHEVIIETHVFDLRIVFYDFTVTKLNYRFLQNFIGTEVTPDNLGENDLENFRW